VELGGKLVQVLAQRLDSHETATTSTVERRRGRETCSGTTCSPKPPRLVMLLFGDVARLVNASVGARAVIHIGNLKLAACPHPGQLAAFAVFTTKVEPIAGDEDEPVGTAKS
jgi:hypothetical protein